MQLGYIEWGIGGASVYEKAETIAGLGFSCISLHPFFFNKEEENAAIKAVNEFNLGVTFHTANETPDAILAKIERYLQTISSFHTSTGRVYCFSFDPYYTKNLESVNPEFDVLAAVILKAIERLSPFGIRVAVENGTSLTLRDEFESLIKKLGKKKPGILLDLGHMNLKWLRGNVPVEDYIYSIPLEIFELHVHDNDAEKDLHQPLGTGNLDLKSSVRALKRRRFDGVATFEMGSPQNTGAEWMEAIKKSREIFLREWENL